MSEILKAFQRHERELKRYLSRFFSREQDIEDIAQEAFIRVFVTDIRTEVRSPRKLLFRAAKHAALSELRKKANMTTDYIEDMGGSSVFLDKDQPDAEDALDAKRKLIAFSKAVASLPPACRTVFILRKFEGLSNREIALRLKITVSAVEKHIASGTVKCSRFLAELGYDPMEFGRRERAKSRSAEPSAAKESDSHE